MTREPSPSGSAGSRCSPSSGAAPWAWSIARRTPTLGRTVAVKTIALTGAMEERDVHEARFLQEARAAGRLSHPAIITIYEMGREGDIAFMAMELLEGTDLRELIHGGELTPSQSVDHRRGGRRGARLRPRARHRASRREARQHHGAARRAREDHGLRHRAPARADA